MFTIEQIKDAHAHVKTGGRLPSLCPTTLENRGAFIYLLCK